MPAPAADALPAGPALSEFGLIAEYFAPLSIAAEGLLLGVGDDCALIAPTPGAVLAVSTDTLVCGRHFLPDAAPADLGWKALAVNLSDLAAMGATPRWYTLALTLPAADPPWLSGFARGLGDMMRACPILLAGGDTTGGPLAFTLTVCGELPAGRGLRRSGARVGDVVVVSGTLGDARAGLALCRGECAALHADDEAWLLERMQRPQPRVAAGQALRDLAHAAIDVSDGFCADLGHILRASGVGARVHVDRLPLSLPLRRSVGDAQALNYALAGGDDYELCVCLPPALLAAAQAACAPLPLTVVGEIVAGSGLRLIDPDGGERSGTPSGFDHFASA